MTMKRFDLDVWEEILVTLTRNKTRSLLTAFGIFWGIFMLVALMGGAQGMQQMLSREFEGFATNSGFIGSNKTGKAYKGFQQGRTWDLENADVERIRRSVGEVEVITPSQARWGINIIYEERSIDGTLKGLYPEYGKIVNRKHFDRLTGVLQECDGHIVYSTGCDAERLKIGPAIIRLGDIGESWMDGLEIMQEEIFGPLMPVITWKSLDDVIRYIDSRPRPLAAYIFTEDGRIKEKLLSSLHFGGGCINDTIIHLASDKLPFGGVGESGMGHYHGSYGFETFSHLKSIVDKPLWLDLPMRYRPYTALKDKLIRMFLK